MRGARVPWASSRHEPSPVRTGTTRHGRTTRGAVIFNQPTSVERSVAPRLKRVTRSTWVAPKTGRRSATPAQPARCRDRPLVLWTSRGLRAPPRSPLVPIGFLRTIGSLVGGEDPCRTHSASTCQGRTGSPAAPAITAASKSLLSSRIAAAALFPWRPRSE